jgi:glucosamine--fructose-6-phosphate aminotransferase (isomerizing)
MCRCTSSVREARKPLRDNNHGQTGRHLCQEFWILFEARGSSDNAAIYGRYLLEVHAGRTASMAAPSVATRYRRDLDLTGTLMVCISQFGRTEEIIQTQDWSRCCGAAPGPVGWQRQPAA